MIARRDKKAFLGDKCKQIEENNRMEKTRDLFKKIRDTKGVCKRESIGWIRAATHPCCSMPLIPSFSKV